MAYVYFPKTSAPISLHADVKDFFGPRDIDNPTATLGLYRRGFAFVPSVDRFGTAINTGVPTVKPINLTDLLGTIVDFYVKKQLADGAVSYAWYDSTEGETAYGATGDLQISFDHEVSSAFPNHFELGMGALGQAEFKYTFSIVSGLQVDVSVTGSSSGWSANSTPWNLQLTPLSGVAVADLQIDVTQQVRSRFDNSVSFSKTVRCNLALADTTFGS